MYFVEKLKSALLLEAGAWKSKLGAALSSEFKAKLKNVQDYIGNKKKILAREVKDLEDVRLAIRCLGEIREDFIDLDLELMLIEETYDLLARFAIKVTKEEQDMADGLRYNFTGLLKLVTNMT